MRLAFISDIHGNALALEAVLESMKQKKVDKIFVLGDLCFRGPEPKRSLDLVRTMGAEVIKGNADEWIVRGVQKGEVPEESLRMMNEERDWTYARLDDDSVAYLKNLPTELNLSFGNINIHAFHATPTSLFEVVQPFEADDHLAEKLFLHDADLYMYAHIHKPYMRSIDGKTVMNIGSVGLPFDGLHKPSYGLVDIAGDDFTTSIVRVDYDVAKVIDQFKQSDYPNVPFMTKILGNAHV